MMALMTLDLAVVKVARRCRKRGMRLISLPRLVGMVRRKVVHPASVHDVLMAARASGEFHADGFRDHVIHLALDEKIGAEFGLMRYEKGSPHGEEAD